MYIKFILIIIINDLLLVNLIFTNEIYKILKKKYLKNLTIILKKYIDHLVL